MSIDGRLLRDALGRYATGVCLITTTTADQRRLALTANSFTSVSLDPPLVLWSLQNNSEVYDLFATPKYFAINVLSGDQIGHSGIYARKGEHLLQDQHFRDGKYGSPVVRGALATFECEMEAQYPGGDHTIIVGRVKSLCTRPTGAPLLFYGGAYGEMH